jgi:hypothetical protein
MNKVWLASWPASNFIEDIFAMSSSQNMDRFSEVFDNIVPLVKRATQRPEAMLGTQLQDHHINVGHIKFVSKNVRQGINAQGYVQVKEE